MSKSTRLTDKKSSKDHVESVPPVLRDKKYINSPPDLCLVDTNSNKRYFVHKILFMCVSPYFQKLYEYCSLSQTEFNYRGKSRAIDTVSFSNVPDGIIDGIVEYCYSGSIEVTNENATDLLIVADMYNIGGLIDRCLPFFEARLDPSNCIGIYLFANAFSCHGLIKIAKNFLLKNFESIQQQSEEFLQDLDAPLLKSLFQQHRLYASDEMTVWTSLINWIKHNERSRVQFFDSLAENIRLGLIQERKLTCDVLLHPYVQQCEPIKQVVSEILVAKKALEAFGPGSPRLELSDTVRRHLTPRYPKDVIFVFGGRTVELEFIAPETLVEVYDHRAERWRKVNIEDPCGPRDHHQVAVVNNCIYIIGGHHGPFNVFNSCRKLNLDTKTWSEIAPMREKRAFLASAVSGKYIYAIGGYNGAWRVKSAERYDVTENQWSAIADMHERRSGAGAAVLDGCIYIVGGFRDLSYLNTAEYYRPDADQWTLISNMLKPRSSPSVVAFEQQLYVIGGLTANGLLSSGERYDPKFGTWLPLEGDMMEKKCSAAAVVLDNKIFVIGGWNGIGGLRTVELWSHDSKRWVLGTKLIKRRTGCVACVVHNISNIEDYAWNNRDNIVDELLNSAMGLVNQDQDNDNQPVLAQPRNGLNNNEANQILLGNQRNFVNGGIDGMDDWMDID